MMHRKYEARIRRHAWLWALLPLLLAAALVAPILGRDVFDVDESATMIGAGARHLGPYTLAEAVHTSVSRWPGQAWGHVVVFSLWGRVAGWSELAIRALPWLTGLLTLAWVYRLGRALFTARIALTATLLLSTSVAFLGLYATFHDLMRSHCSLQRLPFGDTGAWPCVRANQGLAPGPL